MKKTLLSIFAAASCLAMNAADVTIVFSELDPGDISGTYVETAYKDDGSVSAYAHYQPLEAIYSQGYTLTFDANGVNNAPALYDTKAAEHLSLRLYYQKANGDIPELSNLMTITAPEGTTFKQIVGTFDASKKGDMTASVGACVQNDNTLVWTFEDGTNTVTLGALGSIRFSQLVISTDAEEPGTPDTPDTPDEPLGLFSVNFADNNGGFTWDDAEAPEGLNYIWTRDTKYGMLKGSAYLSGTCYACDGAYAVSPVFSLENVTEPKLIMSQAYGPAAYTPEDANAAFTVCIRQNDQEWIELSSANIPEGTQKWEFVETTFDLNRYAGQKDLQIGLKYTSTAEKAVTWEVKTFEVTGNSSAVETLNAESGVATYYNLQGQRIANPERGLYIVVKDGKATKVIR